MAIKGADVTINLPSIDDLIANLGSAKVKAGIGGAASVARGYILDNWNKGLGANDQTLQDPNIESRYAFKKSDSGRRAWINLHWTGDLQRDFKVKNRTDKGATIGWSKPEQLEKARGNYGRRSQMLTVGAKLSNTVREYFDNWIKKNTRGLGA